jgi:putative acetyltransferase
MHSTSRDYSERTLSFFSIREDGALLGVGALKQLDGVHAELKSVHTGEAARGRGVGRAMVAHLVGVARARGYDRVSLETRSMGDPWTSSDLGFRDGPRQNTS